MAPSRHFIASVSANVAWKPGDVLALRGPLGRGFSVPLSARKIGLIAFDDSPARLRGLIQPALKRDASIVLLCASNVDHLPDEVEVQPLSALDDVLKWADYIAADVMRENLSELKERLSRSQQPSAWREAQVLVHTQMPCGGVAECGVCALTTKSSWKLICKDGPVFDLGEI
jgi:NAD(P)H-flavin reductase